LKFIVKRTTTGVVITLSAAMVVLLLATTALGYYTSTRTKLNQNVYALEYDGARNMLYAGYQNGLVYENDLKGGDWESTGGPGASGSSISCLVYDAGRSILYAGCDNGTVYQTDFTWQGWITTGGPATKPVLTLTYDGANRVPYAGTKGTNDIFKKDLSGGGRWFATPTSQAAGSR